MTILVSVVVPTYRRPQLLERCLQALMAQNFPPSAYEVIIVDDGPETEETFTLVSEWMQRRNLDCFFLFPPGMREGQEEIPITGGQPGGTVEKVSQARRVSSMTPRLVYIPAHNTQGPAAARNIGWRAAAGQIIAFTDDDCVPEHDWLANGIAAFEHGAAGVSGRVLVPLPTDPTDNDRNTTGLERSDFVTANCFYRRSVLQEVGGFDERFTCAWREDSDLFFTLQKLNYPLAWSSEAVVLHPTRHEVWGSSLRQQRKTFFNALLYKKHPEFYWRYIQPAPPWQYYGMLACLTFGLFNLLLRHPLPAAAGMAIWAALLIRFILKRLERTSKKPAHVLEIVLTSLIIPALAIYWRLRGSLHWRVLFL